MTIPIHHIPSLSGQTAGRIHVGGYLFWASPLMPFPREAIRAIERAYRRGDSLARIRKIHGVTGPTVQKLMMALGVPLRTRGGQQTSTRATWAAKKSQRIGVQL